MIAYNLITETLYYDTKKSKKDEDRMIEMYNHLLSTKIRVVRLDVFPEEHEINTFDLQVSNVVRLLFDIEKNSNGKVILVYPETFERYVDVIGSDNKSYSLQFVQERISFSQIKNKFEPTSDKIQETIEILADQQKPELTFIRPVSVREDGENIFFVARFN